MTCKDCLHYDVCAVKSKMHTSKEYINGKSVTTDFIESVEERCKHFSPKSQFYGICEKCLYSANCQYLAKHKSDIVEGCTAFKDKHKYIELPCKVGDMVYVIHGDKVRQAVILAFYIDKVGIICELKISMNGAKPTAPCCAAIIDKDTYTDNDIYLTSEAAEKALKERERV